MKKATTPMKKKGKKAQGRNISKAMMEAAISITKPKNKKAPTKFNAKLRKAKAEGKLPKEFASVVKMKKASAMKMKTMKASAATMKKAAMKLKKESAMKLKKSGMMMKKAAMMMKKAAGMKMKKK